MRVFNNIPFAKSKLLRGSAVVLIGSWGGSVINYFYHLAMGRMLKPADYGILVTLLSLIYLISVPGSVLLAAGTKFASKYNAKNDQSAVASSLRSMLKTVGLLGLALMIPAFLARSYLAGFLNIDYPFLIVFFAVYAFFSLLASVPRGYLRGLIKFNAFSAVSFFGPVAKLILGVGLVFIGWGIWGAVGALVVSSCASLLLALSFLLPKLRIRNGNGSFQFSEIMEYTIPTIAFLTALAAFYTTDVILVKHFFSPLQAGIYSSAVTLGRIIYFGLNSVIMVMFPLVSEKFEKGERFKDLFKTAFLIVLAGSAIGTLAYFILPNFLVATFFGSAYMQAVPILGLFGLFMALFSLVSLFAQFFLSVHDFSLAAVLSVLAVLQVLLIWFVHNSLRQILLINITIMVLALLVLGGWYLRKYQFSRKQ